MDGTPTPPSRWLILADDLTGAADCAIAFARRGLEPANLRRLQCLSLFWHFLDVIWIGVFSFVYLLGVLG